MCSLRNYCFPRFFVTALMPVLLLTGCKTFTQMQMDAEVDRLCAKDGGLKIYETVSLPPDKFDKYNQVNFYKATQHENALGPDYIWKWEVKCLYPSDEDEYALDVRRDHFLLFRRSDGKLLGESITYTRRGGDPRWLMEFAGGPPPSHYSCPEDNTTGDIPLLDGVFKKMMPGGKNERPDR